MSQNRIRNINFLPPAPRGEATVVGKWYLLHIMHTLQLWKMTPDIHDQVSNIKSILQVDARFKRGDADSCIVVKVGVLASSHPPSLQLQETSAFTLFNILIWFCMGGFGGGGSGCPPLDLSSYHFFFQARFARQQYILSKYLTNPNNFKVQRTWKSQPL